MAGSRRRTLAVGLAVAVFAACMLLAPGGRPVTQAVTNLASLAMTVAAAVACLVRAALRPGRARWSWAMIGLGCLSYAYGSGAWAWIETLHGGDVTTPGWPDLGFLGMVPLTTAGLVLVPAVRTTRAHRVRGVVDGFMVACALLLISWILVLGPVTGAGATSRGALAVVMAYPAGDIVLITVALYTLALRRRSGEDSAALKLIGAGLALIGLTDSVYAYLTLHAAYTSGGVLDTGWFAAWGLILLAACRPARPDVGGPAGETPAEPVALLLPYAAVLAAVVCTAVSYAMSGGADTVVVWARSVLILLIVIRQLLTLVENKHLTTALEARVGARTVELREREQRFRALLRHSSDSVAVIDADGIIRQQSDSIERIFGWRAAQLLGRRLADILDVEDSGARVAAAIASVVAGPGRVTTLQLPVRHADGRVRLAEMTITEMLTDPVVRGLVLNTRDVHDARELQDRLVHEAYHDRLTGLSGRALFAERIAAVAAYGGRTPAVTVLIVDLDGFQQVNDSLGHAVGDELLIHAAARIKAEVRDGDLVARIGGDEFGVIVPSGTRAEAEAVAGRLVAALREPFTAGARTLHTTVSIGLAIMESVVSADDLIRHADLALSRAKASGGDTVAAYDPAMLAGLVDRLALEADLRAALARDELTLHYQPTVDLRTGGIAGFEALVRWHHPARGMVPPLDFIGIAEASGLIVPLGRWVLTEACRQAVRWGAGGTRPLKMAVNVSVRQFEQGDLAAVVAAVLAETGLPAASLCLEMTESVLLTDTDENLAELHRLKALGVTLAMDDFGTGYSSLAYLRRYPMDILKIDRSFVDRLGAGEREDEALVRTIVRLARTLGMTTVAEGIENAAQLATLRELDCDLAQGYHLSRPLPAAEAGRVWDEGIPAAALPRLAAVPSGETQLTVAAVARPAMRPE
ncbi:putative bifunctional diguanylate cyclase/phosphodiesterase [Symbioplanes lichenis]|uniref:putative bifunctional diguanylate cyclase/phosphodiesterase n=1 Tax=Symbioplanes lichenis TaxID=1629072 RepID=UPI002738B921|nr:GGDEF domain-containing phosphodiesterase [Actinoplanes lichenis]